MREREYVNDLYALYCASRDNAVFDELVDVMDEKINGLLMAICRKRFKHLCVDDVKSELKLHLLQLADKYDANKGVDYYKYIWYNLGVRAQHLMRAASSSVALIEKEKHLERAESVRNSGARFSDVLWQYRKELSAEAYEYVFGFLAGKRHTIVSLKKAKRKLSRAVSNEIEDLIEVKQIKIA